MLRTTIGFLLAAGLLATAGAVYAHHAFSAEFDANLPIQVQGKVTRVDWINPHSWIYVMDESEDGSTQEWMLEAGTPNTLLRRGVTKTILTVGTAVQVRGYQSKDRICEPICRGSGRDITFPETSRSPTAPRSSWAPRAPAPPETAPTPPSRRAADGPSSRCQRPIAAWIALTVRSARFCMSCLPIAIVSSLGAIDTPLMLAFPAATRWS